MNATSSDDALSAVGEEDPGAALEDLAPSQTSTTAEPSTMSTPEHPALRIAVLVGSLRRDSINRRLAAALQTLLPAGVQWQPVAIDDLPLYNQDHEGQPPEPVQRLKREVAAAQALVFVTPEYNRSIPGVLKNAIDWASRPYGSNAFAGKPGAIIGTSPGAIGTANAQQHLRCVLAYLDVPLLGQPEAYLQFKPQAIGDNGGIADKPTAEFLQTWLDAALVWFRRLAERA